MRPTFSAPLLPAVGLTCLFTLAPVGLGQPAHAQQWRSFIAPEGMKPSKTATPFASGPLANRPAAAQRKRVLVLDFAEPSSTRKNRSRGLSTSATLTPGQVLGRRLVRELVAEGSYVLVDASQVSQGENVSLAQAVELGRQVGADAVVVGRLEQLDLTSESTGGSFGNIDLRAKQVIVTVAAKAHLVSTVTGAVLKTIETRGTAQATQPGEFIAGVMGNLFEGRYSALANEATQTVVNQLKQDFVAIEPRVIRLAAQQGRSQQRRLVVLDLNPTSTTRQSPLESGLARRISQMLVSQLSNEDLYIVIYSSQSSLKSRATMADAIEIGRQLDGDLVVFGEIAKVELFRGNSEAGAASPSANARDSEEPVTAIAQINTQILKTSNGELLDRVQVDGSATQVLPTDLSEQLRDRIYEDLLREAAEQAVLRTSDAIFEINYRP